MARMWRHLRAMWRNLRRRRERERDLQDEVSAYYGMLREEGGGPEPGADQVKEAVREVRAGAWIESVGRDVSYAARRLRQRKGYTLAVIAVLGVGIGLTTALFGAVNGLILQPLPFPQPQRLVSVKGVPYAWLLDRKSGAIDLSLKALFSGVAVVQQKTVSLEHPAARIKIAAVSHDFFHVFGTHLLLGQTLPWRAFAAREPAADSGLRAPPPVPVVLSAALWRERYGAAPDILGRLVRWGGVPYQVVGIAPASFAFPAYAQAWVPFTNGQASLLLSSALIDNPLRGSVVARLRPGLPFSAARAQFDAWAASAYAADKARVRPTVRGWRLEPLQTALGGRQRPLALLLWAASGMVLLLALAGALGLSGTQAWERRREMALRLAIGASGARLRRQLLSEGILLGILSGVLGWGVAMLAAHALAHLWSSVPIALPRGLGGEAAAFGLAAALLCGVALGFTGDRRAWTADAALYGRGGGQRRNRSGEVLIALQLGIAAILLTATAALAQSWFTLARVPSGIDARHVLTFEVSLPEQDIVLNEYRGAFQNALRKNAEAITPAERRRSADASTLLARIHEFQNALPERIQALPGVRSVGLLGYLPFQQQVAQFGIEKPGVKGPPRSASDFTMVTELSAGANALATLGMPLLRGRDFRTSDAACCEVIVSRSFMRAFHLHALPATIHGYTVIGVTGEVRQLGLRNAAPPALYTRLGADDPSPFVVVRTAPGVAPLSLMPSVRKVIAALAPEAAISHVTTVADQLSARHAALKEATRLFGLFAVLAALIAALSVFAVATLGAAARTREVGVRMALGARPGDIRRLMLGRQVWITLAALGAAFPLAWVLERALAHWLYQVQPGDVASFAAAAVLLGTLVLTAGWWPAQRAAQAAPMAALRDD